MMSDPTQDVEVVARGESGEGVLYCTVHPTVETSLRCNKCGRPMCSKCAVRTPVGYRCKECVRGQQDVFYKAGQRDYVVAAGVSVVLALIASFIVPYLGLFFTIILAPVAGSVIAEAVHRATGRRRGRYTGYVVLGGLIVGMLPAILPVIEMLLVGVPAQATVTAILEPALFIGITATVAFGWFRYGR